MMRGKLFILALGVGAGAFAVVQARKRLTQVRESLNVENIERRAGDYASQGMRKAADYSRGFFSTLNSARKDREIELKQALFAEARPRNASHSSAEKAEFRARSSQTPRSHFGGLRPGDENDPLDDF